MLKRQIITFAEQLEEGSPGQRAPDLQPLRNHSWGDELVVGNFFVQFVICSLVEEDQVVQLVPHLSFGPLLLKTKYRKDMIHARNYTIKSQLITSNRQVFKWGKWRSSIFTFFFALPPDLLTGSLSFLDLPVSFFCLLSLGG